jgi:hypothetical protein
MRSTVFYLILVLLVSSNLELRCQRQSDSIRVEVLSVEARPQFGVSWEAPTGGSNCRATIERATTDSQWVHVADLPIGLRYNLDSDVEWATEYRYRVSIECDSGSSTTAWSPLAVTDHPTHLDLVEYYLPQPWRVHHYETKYTWGTMPQGTRLDTLYYSQVALDRVDEEPVQRMDRYYQLITRIEFGAADTNLIRYTTDVCNSGPVFYGEAEGAVYGLPPFWYYGRDLTHDTARYRFFDSTRFVPLDVFGGIAPSTIQLICYTPYDPLHYQLRKGFGAYSGWYDASTILPLTYYKFYDIALTSPLGVPDQPPALPDGIGLQIYPNPARGTAHFSLQSPGPATATLYDMLGRDVRTVHGVLGHGELDLHGIRPGVFLLTVQSREGVCSVKLVVAE